MNAAAPLAAIVYPFLVGLASALGPLLLPAALLVPAVAFWLAHARIDPEVHPLPRRITLLTVGAPALFVFLGGWLDGRHWLPFDGLSAWLAIWIGLAWAALATPIAGGRPLPIVPLTAGRATLRTLHGLSAVVILAFAALHLINHVSGVWGGETHWQIMRQLRAVYRNPWIETVLVACVLFQVVSGVRLLWKAAAARTDAFGSLQLASGAYLSLFFASHLSAVVRTRYLRGVDTDWQWLTASPLLDDPWSVRLIPYYWLGVIAFGVHGASALRYILIAHGVSRRTATTLFLAVCCGAVVVSSIIMFGLIVGSQRGSPAA